MESKNKLMMKHLETFGKCRQCDNITKHSKDQNIIQLAGMKKKDTILHMNVLMNNDEDHQCDKITFFKGED